MSSGLPELTDKQKAYAFEHCFKHHAYRTKGGTITCSECGHRWKGGHTLAETICGCSCPHCGKELEILDTRKRVFRDSAYYEIITTRKSYQVLRYFMVGATYKVGQKAEYSIREGLLAHFTQIYHLYNLLIYNILRRNLQLFITEFCIFSPCIIFISNKNSDKSIEILHISPKYITSVDNLMIHIFSSTFNFLYSFTPSDRLESKS